MTMTCEAVRNELVAYRDGELPERTREWIAAHLHTCAACAQEEAQLARVSLLLTNLERVTPSPDFAATFWRRLEQEGEVEQESHLGRWWRELRENWTGWQWAPALAGAASLLVFLGYVLSSRSPTPTTRPLLPEVPAQLVEQLGLFVNYKIIADLDRFEHFDEIAAIQPPPKQATELAEGEDVPPALLENPSFFTHYPILQRMDQLQNLETVLDAPAKEDAQHRG
jgi:hypothetical protein